MNIEHKIEDPDMTKLCQGVQNSAHIAIGANGFSVCLPTDAGEGDCHFEGIQDLSVAHELSEMLIGELEHSSLETQRNPNIVFG
ncbi:MAG: hypothetical protein HQL96_07925 [Magnetococcales bacterium]|nr:hypothetical protein [Magnetococcales bacterium]